MPRAEQGLRSQGQNADATEHRRRQQNSEPMRTGFHDILLIVESNIKQYRVLPFVEEKMEIRKYACILLICRTWKEKPGTKNRYLWEGDEEGPRTGAGG